MISKLYKPCIKGLILEEISNVYGGISCVKGDFMTEHMLPIDDIPEYDYRRKNDMCRIPLLWQVFFVN